MNTLVSSIAKTDLLAVSRSTLLRAGDFLALTKPRVMSLVVFTALVGLLSAPAAVHLADGLIAIICIAAGAGAAGTLNMWYDADIDAIMPRTAGRPIPRGRVQPAEALAFGLALAVGSIVVLGLFINVVATALLALTIAFYVLVYTVWLKRSSVHNIVIGGAAGAFPPMIGWAAATGSLSVEPLLLFLIIFFWTPPHFWALSLYRSDDYARAGVPMLPPVSILPWALAFVGVIYGTVAILAIAKLILLAWQLQVGGKSGERTAKRLFAFSILYLFSLFAAFLVDKQLAASFAFNPACPHSHQLLLAERICDTTTKTGDSVWLARWATNILPMASIRWQQKRSANGHDLRLR
jgi:heme o synthase